MHDKESSTVHVRLPNDMVDLLKVLAERDGRSVSNLIRKLTIEFIAREQEVSE